MKYRPEIDGLRAIAVLSVIFYHAKISIGETILFTKGYIGVDVFFVISGYLITSILLKEMKQGTFSYTNFYERRIRRILPALYFVMLVSIPVAVMIMLPNKFVNFTQSILSSIFFISNIFFWQEDNYFAEISSLKPFIHTWTLSVEEQFYILFPILLSLCWKFFRKNLTSLIILGILFSFSLAYWGSSEYPSATFFLLHTRGWELLAGALLAKIELKNKRPSSRFMNILMPLTGIILILYPDFSPPDNNTLVIAPAVIGTMLILWYGSKGDLTSKILSSKLLVGIGLISYSLYLWHQPVFALYTIYSVNPPNTSEKIKLITLIFVLSYFSWRFIEKPFRNKSNISPSLLLKTLVFSTIILVTICLCANYSRLFIINYPAEVQKAAEFQQQEDKIYKNIDPNLLQLNPEIDCNSKSDWPTRTYNSLQGIKCPDLDIKRTDYWLLIGDSYARKIYIIQKEMDKLNIPLLHSIWLACPFLPGFKSYNDAANPEDCDVLNEKRIAAIKKLPPMTIILTARTQLHVEQKDFDLNKEDGNGGPIKMLAVNKEDNKDISRAIQRSYTDSVKFLLEDGNKVVLIYPLPEIGVYPPDQIVKEYRSYDSKQDWIKWEKQGGFTNSYRTFQKRTKRSYEAYDAVPDSPNLLRIYPEKLFCNTKFTGKCINHDKNHIYYNDSGHLSSEGAKILIDHIMANIKDKWGLPKPKKPSTHVEKTF